MSNYLTINTWMLTKNYDSERVKEKEKRGCDYKRFEIIYNKDEGPKLTKREKTETKKTDETQKTIMS